MNDGALRVYLNDHLAGSVLEAQTARHLLAHRPEGALAEFLRAFLSELTEERAIISEVMVLLAAPLNPFKLLGAWALEKAQELKLQRFFVRFTEVTCFNELEALCVGVEGKRLMWRTLASLALSDPRLAQFDFAALGARAAAQEAALWLFRASAAGHAFGHRESAEALA